MTNKFNDTYLQSLDKRLRELRRELEEELGMYRDSDRMTKKVKKDVS